MEFVYTIGFNAAGATTITSPPRPDDDDAAVAAARPHIADHFGEDVAETAYIVRKIRADY